MNKGVVSGERRIDTFIKFPLFAPLSPSRDPDTTRPLSPHVILPAAAGKGESTGKIFISAVYTHTTLVSR